jgi:hypothetical protein
MGMYHARKKSVIRARFLLENLKVSNHFEDTEANERVNNKGRFVKTWPIKSTYISNAILDVVINRVPHVIGSFRFPGKSAVLLPTADRLCILELNKMATP